MFKKLSEYQPIGRMGEPREVILTCFVDSHPRPPSYKYTFHICTHILFGFDLRQVAALILYLASDESKFVTGAAYAIDGGVQARM